MILKGGGFYIVEAGGLSLFVDHAYWHERIPGIVQLMRVGESVGMVFVEDKGAKARIKELKKVGLLKGKSAVNRRCAVRP